MYSILKSQKRSITHKKNITVTSSAFITNSHIVLTFSDCSCVLYSLNLSESQSQQALFETQTVSIVTHIKRLSEGVCVMLCKNLTAIYSFQYMQNTIQHTFKVQLKQLFKSNFAQMISSQIDTGLLNTLGCEVTLHGFNNNCFIIQYFVYEDRKVILDCYQYKSLPNTSSTHQTYGKQKQNNTVHNWQTFTLDIDIEINGHYTIDSINSSTGQLALYKQSQLTDVDWVVRVFSPFTEAQVVNPHNPINEPTHTKQVKINLPDDKFTDDTSIMQICQYLDGLYMIIVSSKTTGKLRAYALNGLNNNTVGNVPQAIFSFQEISQFHSAFLQDNFIKMMYINPKDQLFYALTHKHQIVDGEIYFNGLIIGNLRTGKSIQKGYCSLRNIDFSPNHRYILDVPYEYDKVCSNRTLYHIRLLLSKSSLYMLLIQNTPVLQSLSERFKNIMIQML